MALANSLVVLDFETTGMSPDMGDRAIEIGAVKITEGKVTARFQQLMNPGRRVSGFIEEYTGISNGMLATAAPCEEVMHEFADFISDSNLVAHNASFDKRFLDAELDLISRQYSGEFACSMLAARRLYQSAPNHKLGTLVDYIGVPVDGQFHRALFDAEMTTTLWLDMLEQVTKYGIDEVNFDLMQTIGRTPKAKVERLLQQYV